MFTLDAVRRIPSVDTEKTAGHNALHDREIAPVTTPGPEDRQIDHSADQSAHPSSDANGIAEIRRSLAQDLHEADTAIRTGRIEDAHRALIHAQDTVFERHLALGSLNGRPAGRRSSDLLLHLTDRLIDANRFKDRAIIAECRSLLDLVTETCSCRLGTSG